MSYIERKTEGFEKVKTPAGNSEGFTVEMKYVAAYYRYSRLSLTKARVLHILLEILKGMFLYFGYSQYSACNLYSYSGRMAVAALVPELFCVLGVLFFLFYPEYLHVSKYREMRNLICIGSGVSSLVLGVSALGCCLYTATAGLQNVIQELWTIFFFVLAMAMGIILSSLQRKKCYEKVERV